MGHYVAVSTAGGAYESCEKQYLQCAYHRKQRFADRTFERCENCDAIVVPRSQKVHATFAIK